MNLSANFTLDEATYSETAVRMGINNQPNEQQLENMVTVARNMEKVRDVLGGKGIRVNSWLRLPEVNVAVGGSAKSSHMDGWAVDFTCAGFGDPYAVAKAIEASGIKYSQLIHEFGRWTHISFAPDMKQQALTIFKPDNKYKAGILTADEYAQSA
jgi:zinc D-Ala-D-Ala carboxypeptidase